MRTLVLLLLTLALPALPALAQGEIQDRNAFLQERASRFPLVEVGQTEGRCTPFSLTLNRNAPEHDGQRYDGFRFRTPAGRRDLLWAFFYDDAEADKSGWQGWYIVPVEGSMRGFENFQPTGPEVPSDPRFGIGDPAGHKGVLQILRADRLEPGREYLMWFSFEGTSPVALHAAINLLPADPDVGLHSVPPALGLDLVPAP